jgi:hypothetical protein
VLQVHEEAVRLVDDAIVEVAGDVLSREACGHFPLLLTSVVVMPD